MAKKKKNSNYVTEKTVAKKQMALKAKRNAKTKRYALLAGVAVLIAACIIAGLVLIAMGINKHYEKEYFKIRDNRYEDSISTSIDKHLTLKTTSSCPGLIPMPHSTV